MTRTGSAAKANALSKVGSRVPAGYCLQFTRGCFDIPVKYPSAIAAWNGAQHKHTGKPPSGAVVPVFFRSSSPFRHVAVFLGDGRVVTVNGTSVYMYSSIDVMAQMWNAPYMGWSEDLNGVRVYTPPPPKPTYTDVKSLQKALGAAQDNVFGPDSTKRGNAVRTAAMTGTFPYGVKYTQKVIGTTADGAWGPKSKAALVSKVKAVQKALGVTADGSWGPKTDAAYKARIKGAKKS